MCGISTKSKHNTKRRGKLQGGKTIWGRIAIGQKELHKSREEILTMSYQNFVMEMVDIPYFEYEESESDEVVKLKANSAEEEIKEMKKIFH